MKRLAVLALAIGMLGCVSAMPAERKTIKSLCIDGVTYLVFPAYGYEDGYFVASAKFGRDSKVIPCE